MSTIDAYLDSLTVEVFDQNLRPYIEAPTRGGGTTTPATPTAAVNAGVVLSFADGLSNDERRDVLESVQLAHRAASGEFNWKREIEPWWERFTQVLNKLGWTVETQGFVKHDEQKREVRVDESALSVVAAIATGGALPALSAALEALRKLRSDAGAITLFRRHAVLGDSANFQLGAATRGQTGAIVLALGAFRLHTKDGSGAALFGAWSGNLIDFWSAAVRMTFNREYYGLAREKVREKLGDSSDFIKSLSV